MLTIALQIQAVVVGWGDLQPYTRSAFVGFNWFS
jgi:hypothetical protein